MIGRSGGDLALLAVLWGLTVLLALTWPRLDLEVMTLVHEMLDGRFAGTGGVWAPLYSGLPYLIYTIAIAAVLALGAGLSGWMPARRRLRDVLVVLGTLFTHLLIVEALLKNHWGRARPRDLTEFGGWAQYSAPLAPADQCASNCAFVSGHAGAAFTLLAVALITPARWRTPAVFAALGIGLLTGAMRVVQGAHFPFDVIFAGLIVGGVAVLLARFLPQTKPRLATAP